MSDTGVQDDNEYISAAEKTVPCESVMKSDREAINVQDLQTKYLDSEKIDREAEQLGESVESDKITLVMQAEEERWIKSEQQVEDVDASTQPEVQSDEHISTIKKVTQVSEFVSPTDDGTSEEIRESKVEEKEVEPSVIEDVESEDTGMPTDSRGVSMQMSVTVESVVTKTAAEPQSVVADDETPVLLQEEKEMVESLKTEMEETTTVSYTDVEVKEQKHEIDKQEDTIQRLPIDQETVKEEEVETLPTALKEVAAMTVPVTEVSIQDEHTTSAEETWEKAQQTVTEAVTTIIISETEPYKPQPEQLVQVEATEEQITFSHEEMVTKVQETATTVVTETEVVVVKVKNDVESYKPVSASEEAIAEITLVEAEQPDLEQTSEIAEDSLPAAHKEEEVAPIESEAKEAIPVMKAGISTIVKKTEVKPYDSDTEVTADEAARDDMIQQEEATYVALDKTTTEEALTAVTETEIVTATVRKEIKTAAIEHEDAKDEIAPVFLGEEAEREAEEAAQEASLVETEDEELPEEKVEITATQATVVKDVTVLLTETETEPIVTTKEIVEEHRVDVVTEEMVEHETVEKLVAISHEEDKVDKDVMESERVTDVVTKETEPHKLQPEDAEEELQCETAEEPMYQEEIVTEVQEAATTFTTETEVVIVTVKDDVESYKPVSEEAVEEVILLEEEQRDLEQRSETTKQLLTGARTEEETEPFDSETKAAVTRGESEISSVTQKEDVKPHERELEPTADETSSVETRDDMIQHEEMIKQALDKRAREEQMSIKVEDTEILTSTVSKEIETPTYELERVIDATAPVVTKEAEQEAEEAAEETPRAKTEEELPEAEDTVEMTAAPETVVEDVTSVLSESRIETVAVTKEVVEERRVDTEAGVDVEAVEAVQHDTFEELMATSHEEVVPPIQGETKVEQTSMLGETEVLVVKEEEKTSDGLMTKESVEQMPVAEVCDEMLKTKETVDERPQAVVNVMVDTAVTEAESATDVTSTEFEPCKVQPQEDVDKEIHSEAEEEEIAMYQEEIVTEVQEAATTVTTETEVVIVTVKDDVESYKPVSEEAVEEVILLEDEQRDLEQPSETTKQSLTGARTEEKTEPFDVETKAAVTTVTTETEVVIVTIKDGVESYKPVNEEVVEEITSVQEEQPGETAKESLTGERMELLDSDAKEGVDIVTKEMEPSMLQTEEGVVSETVQHETFEDLVAISQKEDAILLQSEEEVDQMSAVSEIEVLVSADKVKGEEPYELETEEFVEQIPVVEIEDELLKLVEKVDERPQTVENVAVDTCVSDAEVVTDIVTEKMEPHRLQPEEDVEEEISISGEEMATNVHETASSLVTETEVIAVTVKNDVESYKPVSKEAVEDITSGEKEQPDLEQPSETTKQSCETFESETEETITTTETDVSTITKHEDVKPYELETEPTVDETSSLEMRDDIVHLEEVAHEAFDERTRGGQIPVTVEETEVVTATVTNEIETSVTDHEHINDESAPVVVKGEAEQEVEEATEETSRVETENELLDAEKTVEMTATQVTVVKGALLTETETQAVAITKEVEAHGVETEEDTNVVTLEAVEHETVEESVAISQEELPPVERKIDVDQMPTVSEIEVLVAAGREEKSHELETAEIVEQIPFSESDEIWMQSTVAHEITTAKIRIEERGEVTEPLSEDSELLVLQVPEASSSLSEEVHDESVKAVADDQISDEELESDLELLLEESRIKYDVSKTEVSDPLLDLLPQENKDTVLEDGDLMEHTTAISVEEKSVKYEDVCQKLLESDSTKAEDSAGVTPADSKKVHGEVHDEKPAASLEEEEEEAEEEVSEVSVEEDKGVQGEGTLLTESEFSAGYITTAVGIETAEMLDRKTPAEISAEEICADLRAVSSCIVEEMTVNVLQQTLVDYTGVVYPQMLSCETETSESADNKGAELGHLTETVVDKDVLREHEGLPELEEGMFDAQVAVDELSTSEEMVENDYTSDASIVVQMQTEEAQIQQTEAQPGSEEPDVSSVMGFEPDKTVQPSDAFECSEAVLEGGHIETEQEVAANLVSTVLKTAEELQSEKLSLDDSELQKSREVSVPQTLVTEGGQSTVVHVMRSVEPDGEIVEQIVRMDSASAVEALGALPSPQTSLCGESGEESEPAVSAAAIVYSDTVEERPDSETEMNEYEELLPDGTRVRRKVVKTTRHEAVTRRVVVEETSTERSQLSARSEEPPPAFLRYSDRAEEGPVTVTLSDETSCNTLSDGRSVVTHSVVTSQQKLVMERTFVAGVDSTDVDLKTTEDLFSSSEAAGNVAAQYNVNTPNAICIAQTVLISTKFGIWVTE